MASSLRGGMGDPVEDLGDLEARIAQHDRLLVLFNGDWDAKSRALASTVEAALTAHPAVPVALVDMASDGGAGAALDSDVTKPGVLRLYSAGQVEELNATDPPSSVHEAVAALAAGVFPSDAATALEVAPAAGDGTASAEAATAPAPEQPPPAPFVSPMPGLAELVTKLCAAGGCLRLHIAGDKTHCGKTTVALGVLGGLLRAGVPADKLAYIKPATQCEAPDLLLRWCEAHGVTYVGGSDAPLVFFRGFTREFLEGRQGRSQDWIDAVEAGVNSAAAGKSFVLVDGVGFPGVGSCVGVSNAEVAKAARAPVLLVGKSGVGGAIDAYSLNSAFFAQAQVPVLGGVFNRGATEGFYRWDLCQDKIQTFFGNVRPRERCYGVLPNNPVLADVREKVPDMAAERALELAEVNVEHVCKYVNLEALVLDAAMDPWNRRQVPLAQLLGDAAAKHIVPPPVPAPAPKPTPLRAPATSPKRKTRAEIEAAAKAKGASGG